MKAIFPAFIALSFFLLLLAGVTSPPSPEHADVIGITDGDTIQTTTGIVRYIGIDAPERTDPCGSLATQIDSMLTLGKRVRLEKDTRNTDQYGRLLRYVYDGDRFINEQLVRAGWARATPYPPDTKHEAQLKAAELYAQTNRLGIWGTCPQPGT